MEGAAQPPAAQDGASLARPELAGSHWPATSYGELRRGVGSGTLSWAVWPSPGKGLKAHSLTELRRSHGSADPRPSARLWSLGPLPPTVWLQRPLTRGLVWNPSWGWGPVSHPLPGREPVMRAQCGCLKPAEGIRRSSQTVPGMGLRLPACTAAPLSPCHRTSCHGPVWVLRG